MSPTKRDRWASSSDEDEDVKPKAKTSANGTKRGKADSSADHAAATAVPVAVNAIVETRDGAAASASSLTQRLHNPLLSGCRSVYDTYERIQRISEGSYGIVWKARDLATGTTCALKQIKFHGDNASQPTPGMTSGLAVGNSYSNSIWKEGFPVTALREINVLLALQHESIVSVREMVVGDAIDQVYMVMEYFECDLKEALQKSCNAGGGPLAQAELKGILQQILSGMQYMHVARYMHRDIKPSNILVKLATANNNGGSGGGGGRIALADFGLARRFQSPPSNSSQLLTLPVVTLWYRAPELLFGDARYGPAIDMWSIGCVMGELIQSGGSNPTSKQGNNIEDEEEEDDSGNTMFKGQGEVDQIDQIFAMVGVPNERTWPSFAQLPNAGLLRWKPIPDEDILLPKLFPIASMGRSSQQTFLDANGYRLLQGLLTLDPAQRLTARQAYDHDYFAQGVAPRIPHFFASS